MIATDHGEENVGGKPKPLLLYLLSRFAITPEEYEDIISMKTSYDQMAELISILMCKPVENFDTLCDGLRLSDGRYSYANAWPRS